jgi:DUF1009 family protein
LNKARAKILAIEADKTIVVDREKVIELANSYGMIIVAVKNNDDPARPDIEGGLRIHS